MDYPGCLAENGRDVAGFVTLDPAPYIDFCVAFTLAAIQWPPSRTGDENFDD